MLNDVSSVSLLCLEIWTTHADRHVPSIEILSESQGRPVSRTQAVETEKKNRTISKIVAY